MKTSLKSKVLFDGAGTDPIQGGCMVYEDG